VVSAEKLPATKIHSKVGAGALGANVAVLVVFGLEHFGHMALPDTVAVALTGVIVFGFSYIAKS
jgi:hypothetical protein